MAQQSAGTSTIAELQGRLNAFAEAPDTVRRNANKPRKGDAKWAKNNDLVIISGNGTFPGILDGGGGTNVLRLDDAKRSKLAHTRNFIAFQVTNGEWEHTGRFTGWGVIEPTTGLINTCHIDGQVGVFGELKNKGTV